MKPEKIREKLRNGEKVSNSVDSLISSDFFKNKEDNEKGNSQLKEKREMAKKIGLDPDLVEDFHKRIEKELP